MTEEAPLEKTEAGLVPGGEGWFVMNAQEARWIRRDGRGVNLPLTGWTEDEAETWFPDLGIALIRLQPGEPVGMYHWEADTEDFLVLAGEATLIVEATERPLRRWDYVHCPPGTKHIILGAGDGPCVVLGMSSRNHLDENCGGGAYTVEEAALRHGAGVETETDDADVAYERYRPSEPTRYEEGWLP